MLFNQNIPLVFVEINNGMEEATFIWIQSYLGVIPSHFRQNRLQNDGLLRTSSPIDGGFPYK